MMKKSNLFFIIISVFFLSSYSQEKSISLPLIPLPKECKLQSGSFTLSSTTQIVTKSNSLQNEIDFLNQYLNTYYGFKLNVISTLPKAGNYILFDAPDWEAGLKENYHLNISKQTISILAEGNGAGNFYAIQTLIQLLPIQKNNQVLIPCVQIKDAPRFQWRGMHLDVCRHFFSTTFIKKYIDLMAMYKMNTFHWHLTEDQAWRIEIKKYPKLTSVGAWRKGSMIGAYKDQTFDSIPYGGFYTQEEIKEIVSYATKRHITIVPEIEMPGHSVAAIAAYPWLSCAGKQLEVEKSWGVFEDVYCTKDSTFQFLENVLDEVIALFPSQYIHIGGDESPKTRWKVCAQCQSVIKKEKLKDEHELQSYFIKRIEKYLNSKGKQIIGWDEILEGGLAPNAAVMSWRGTEGGIAAAKQKHNVVMTPGSHCYFDHYQSSPTDEPLAIGGYTPLEKVYAYEPIPKELNAEEQHYILGAQANVWTEYISTEKHVEYMAVPRMAALAEVLWTPKEKKDETNFLERVQTHFLFLDKLNVNYAKAIYKVEYKVSPSLKTNALKLELNANQSLGNIYYTTDGNLPTMNSLLYKEPIELNKELTIKSALFKNNEQKGKVVSRDFVFNKATNKKVSLKTPPSNQYKTGGSFTLVNGIVAKQHRINEEWLGWNGEDMEAIVDLENETEISKIKIGFLNEELNWIYLPKEVEFLVSNDGVSFKNIGVFNFKDFNNGRFAFLEFEKSKVKFVKIKVKNYGKILSGKPGAGENAWLFCDEIIIN